MTTARSEDYRLPLWLRVTAIAIETAEVDVLGTHTATFAPGELRERLGGGVDLHPTTITRAIRSAVRHGLLADGSCTRSLRLVRGSLTQVAP